MKETAADLRPGNVPPPPPVLRGIVTAKHRAFFRALPKVELHCHLFGTVRHATFLEMSRRRRAPFTRAEIDAFYTRDRKSQGILRVLRALDRYLVATPDDLYRMAREYLEDAAAYGVRYSEFFWNPTGTVKVSRIPYRKAQEAIVRAIRDAERDHGIVGRLIASIDREATPADAVEMAGWVTAHRAPEVIGLGIDYRENDRPPELFWKAYRLAKRAGLKTTAHAGEFGMPWTNVETCLELLGCDRIDHGYTIVDNPALARACAERGVLFTVVPTNSYYLRTLPYRRWAEDHPIRKMALLGLKIHPNSDDPPLHQVTAAGAWQLMFSHFGFSLDELRDLMRNGLDGAWIDAGTRRRWRRDWTAEFNRLRGGLIG